MNSEDAIALAVDLLVEEFGQAMKTPSLDDVVIRPELMVEFATAWSVPFNTQQYLDTDDPIHALIPSVIVIPKDCAIAPHVAPSAIDTAEYLDAVASGEMPWTVRQPRKR